MRTLRGFAAVAAAMAFAGGLAFDAAAACKDCGTVVDVRTVKKEGEASGAGAVIGGIAGGVLGHQVEKSRKSTTSYQVVVKLEDGRTRTFSYADPTSYRVGDKVKIVDKKLTRQ